GLRLWRESSCDGRLAYHYRASWDPLLRDCYGQVLRPRLYPSKLADCLGRHPGAWIRPHPHFIWQATESYLEGGNTFGPIFHLGFLTRSDCRLTRDNWIRHVSSRDHGGGGGGGGRGGRGGDGLGLGGCAALATGLRIAITPLRRSHTMRPPRS